ncbi:MAG: EcsC family protein [Candidatus Omnitrophica bacterium]|nr:EcsC family protein [Candidatus Omnitrophota bacterium]
MLKKCWHGIRFLLFLMRGGALPPKEESLSQEETLSTMDENAQALLNGRMREVWYSFSPVQWLDLKILQSDCRTLVQQIAGIYFPEAKQPELEVTLLELLQFNERIAHRLRLLLEEFPSFHRLTIANILEARSLLERTKQTIDKKGVQTSRRIASRIWTAINAINPNYWIQRFLFRGASEMIGRKVLTSVYRIVGVEAIRLYQASARQTHLKTLDEKDIIEPEAIMEEVIQEKSSESANLASEGDSRPENPDQKEEKMTQDQEWIFPGEENDSPENKSKEDAEKLGSSITRVFSSFIEGSLHLWDKMVSLDKVIESFQTKGESVQCLSDIEKLPVESLDEAADGYIRKGRWATAAEGAATGFGGFLLLSADAVSLLALQLRTIQQIGYCYGFDVSRPEEKLFAAKLLAEAYNHPAGKEKDALKREMRMAAGMLGGKTPFGLLQKRLFVQGFSKIAQKIGLRFGSRKAAQFVPILGSAVGGIVNQQVTKDIANTAKEVYRDRLLEKKKYDKKDTTD